MFGTGVTSKMANMDKIPENENTRTRKLGERRNNTEKLE